MNRGPILKALHKCARAALAQDCLLCGGASGDELLCAGCRADLPVLAASCPRCAVPTRLGLSCGACLGRPPHFDRTVAVWRYEFPCDVMVQALKYRARLPLARVFARALAARIESAVDLAIPMPLHRSRLAERGFNHAAEIARELARGTGCAFAAAGLRRVRHTVPQTTLPFAERAANVRGAFACTADVRGKRVAVVDDVMTTGTSLDEVACVLKAAGALTVDNWVVARTLLD
jgi:ComF family protein